MATAAAAGYFSRVKNLHTGELFSIDLDEEGRAVWLKRTARASAGATAEEFGDIERKLGALDRRLTLIVDVRDAPGRNDSEFEERVLPQFRRATSFFPRRALFVRTAVGKMQVLRLADGAERITVLTDEASVRAFIAAPPAAPIEPRPRRSS